MPAPLSFHLGESRQLVPLLHGESSLRTTWTPDGQHDSTALVRRLVGQVPTGESATLRESTLTSRHPSGRVERALGHLSVIAGQAGIGNLLVNHGGRKDPSVVFWAADEQTKPMQSAELAAAPAPVLDTLSAARAVQTAITGGWFRRTDDSFS